MVNFVGAGSGAPDLITIRGKKFLESADIIIYAGSLVNPQLLEYAKPECEIFDSAKMTLEEVIDVILRGEGEGKMTVRLHTGDPCVITFFHGHTSLFHFKSFTEYFNKQINIFQLE